MLPSKNGLTSIEALKWFFPYNFCQLNGFCGLTRKSTADFSILNAQCIHGKTLHNFR